ncbi:MAG: transporter, YbiR family [Firmicutes bacterium]|nr:transporter, YbiR family [Bacillota bacterium]
MKNLRTKLLHFLQKELVLCIAGMAAILTMLIVPPSIQYLTYIDFRVLGLLFCLMAVVAGFNKTGIFVLLSEKILMRVANVRSIALVLVLLCFFSSMWITNDVALITFVPFGILILTMTGHPKHILKLVVLQTIAANLGSMLTPVGNPQNLYLYSEYNISILEFLKITIPYTLFSLLLLCIVVLLIPKEHISFTLSDTAKKDKHKPYTLAMYSGLFLVCLACVVRLIDYRVTLLIIVLCILFFDRTLFRKVDYSLLLTFVFFFIFVGNIGNIALIRDFLASLLTGRELIVSILASQVISNVPAAVLLSAFTTDYKSMILGTDLGGLGTLVASLASLISYKFYSRTEGANTAKYLRVFTIYNVGFLSLLLLFYYIMKLLS